MTEANAYSKRWLELLGAGCVLPRELDSEGSILRRLGGWLGIG